MLSRRPRGADAPILVNDSLAVGRAANGSLGSPVFNKKPASTELELDIGISGRSFRKPYDEGALLKALDDALG
jgi:hypothetical protein